MTEPKVATPAGKKPDWMLNVLQNKIPLTLAALHEEDLATGQFSIRDREDYWNRDDVKQAFTDDKGVEQRGQFDEFFTNQESVYKNNLAAESWLSKNSNAYSSKYAKQLGNLAQAPVVLDGIPDLNGRSYDSNRTEEGKYGEKKYGIRENAINNYVLKDGKKMTVEQFYEESNADGRFFNTDTLKFAKDEYGANLIGDNNRPYMVPVGHGERLKSYDELYSGFSDAMGRYGTGEGFGATVGGVISSVAKAPINVAASTIEGFAVTLQAINSFAGLDESEFQKNLVDVTNRFNASKITSSEKALNDWTSIESLIGMGSEAGMQLVALMSGGAALKAIGASAKVASTIPITAMGMMSAAPIYNLARERGYTAREAATMFSVAVGGFSVLAKADDVLVKSIMGKSGISSKMLQEVAEKTMNLNVKGSLSSASLKSISKSFPHLLKKSVAGFRQGLNNIPNTTLAKSAGSAVVESVQETTEQIWDTSVRGLGNLYSDLRYDGVEDAPSFNIVLSEEIQSYKQAAVGGAIGGAMAAPIMRHFYGKGNSADDKLVGFMKSIVNGDEQKIYDLINRLKEEGRFGTPWADPKGKLLNVEELDNEKDGTTKLEDVVAKSENAIGADIFKKHVESLVEIRDSLGLKDFKFNSENQLNGAQNKALEQLSLATGFFNAKDYSNVTPEDLYSKYSTMGRDAGSLAIEISKLDSKIAEGKNGDLSDDIIEQLTSKKERLKNRLDNITSGKFKADYITEAIYNYKSFSKDADSKEYHAITGKSYSNLNNKIKSDTSNRKSAINKSAIEQKEANETSTIDSFEGVSKTRKSGLLSEAIGEQSIAAKKLYKASDISEEMQQSLSPEQLLDDPSIRDSVEGKAYQDITKKINALQKYNAEDDITAVTADNERDIELSQYLNMTAPDDSMEVLGLDEDKAVKKSLATNLELDTSTGESIDGKLILQLEEFKNSIDGSGTPLYSNIEAPKDILNSINNRKAQLLANKNLNGFNNIPKITDAEYKKLRGRLDSLEESTLELYIIAQQNLTNPEVAINAATLYKLSNISMKLDSIADKFIKGDGAHAAVAELITNARPLLTKAIEDSDITTYLKELNKLEDSIYDIYSGDNNDLKDALRVIKPESFSDVDTYLAYKAEYDYFYGIVSLKSSDFYDLYNDVLTNSAVEVSPSAEQRLIIKEASQKLAINGYSIEMATPDTVPGYTSLIDLESGTQNILSDSVYIDGSGGTGKTSMVQPIIVGIASKISGGKIFATSVNKGNKISNIRKINKDFGGLNLTDGVTTIDELLKNPEKLEGIGVIVFDEATLLNNKVIGKRNEFTSTKEELLAYGLKDIQLKVNAFNEGKTKGRLKVIYTGDTNQNTQNQDNDNISNGISDKTNQYLPRTDRLTFSFRQQNQDLKSLADYIKASHDAGVTSKTRIKLNNEVKVIKNEKGEDIGSERVGVTVTKSNEKFNKQVKDFINTLSADQIKNTVYITDKDDVPGYITEKGITITTSIYAQGEEWDNAIIDLSEPLFSDISKNYGVKKSYYTAITRAKKYALINLPNVENISSKSGKVYSIKPLTLKSTMANEISTIEQILDRAAEQYEGGEGKQPISQPQPKVTPEEHNIFKEEDDEDFRVKLAKFLGRFADDSMQFHTFFTTQRGTDTNDEGVENLKDVKNAKRKFLYSDLGASEHGYRLVVAKQGSPEYNNVVRNENQYDNQYAIFLEGYDKSSIDTNPVKSTVVGILGDSAKGNSFKTELNEFIIDSGIFLDGSTDTISMPIDNSLFIAGQVRGASARKTKSGSKAIPKTVQEIKNASDGISFGTIRIFQHNVLNEDGSIKYRRGESFIAASFRYSSEKLNEILDSYDGDLTKETRFTPLLVTGKALDSTQIFDMLSDELRLSTNGRSKKLPDPTKKIQSYALSTKLGAMYASAFGRYTVSGKGDKNQRKVSSYWNNAYEKLYADAVAVKTNINNKDTQKEHELYLAFLNRNRLNPNSEITDVEQGGVKNGYITLKPGVEIPADVLRNSATNINNSKPYFFFQKYIDAKENGTKEVRHFEKALEDIRLVKIKVSRRDKNDPTKEVSIEKQPFINGFEFNVVAAKGLGKSSFIKSAEEASPEAYGDNLVIRGIDYVSEPSVNVSMKGIIDGLLSSKIEPDMQVQQTAKTIEDGELDEEGTQEIGADNEDINNPDPISATSIEEDFDTIEGTTLVDFQEQYYPDTNVNHMMEGISMFKRGIWNSLFNLTPVNGETPSMTLDFGKSINARRESLDSIREKVKGQGKILLNDEANPELKAQYHASVGSAAFDFLMKSYFPTFKLDAETGVYSSPTTTSSKSNIFNKETASLFGDTANELVTTMLFNTKELYEKNGEIFERDNYLSKADVEDMVDIFSTFNTHDELVAAMKSHVEGNNSTLPAILSIYHQYYSETPYSTNGQNTHSLSNIDNSMVAADMVDALSVFLRTASPYKYVHVNLNGDDKTIKGVPSAGGLKPNILRHSLGETIKTNAPLIGEDVKFNSNTGLYSIKVIDGDIVDVSSRARLSESDIVRVFQKIGVSGYTQELLNELKKTSPITNDSILDRTTVLLYDILGRIQAAKTNTPTTNIKSFSQLLGGDFEELVVKPMVKLKGVHDELGYRNLNGDIVSRLRNKIVINNVSNTINDIRLHPTSVNAFNMFVEEPTSENKDRVYKIVDWVAKDGIKYFNKGFTSSRSHGSFITSESMEYEIFWNFFETIRNTADENGTVARAIFSPMAYSDGSTDVAPVIELTKNQIENPDDVLKALFESRRESYARMDKMVKAGEYDVDLSKNQGFKDNVAEYVDGDFAAFRAKIYDNLTILKANIEEDAGFLKTNIQSAPQTKFGIKTFDEVIKSFYFNWLAVSSELGDITLGKIDNFKLNGTTSDKYVDFTKRAKMLVSSRNGTIFRNANWAERVASEGLTPKLMREGYKMQRFGEVMFIKDVEKSLISFDKSNSGVQEVWDGATFTNPITKIYQQASSGGRFGVKVPTVAKPVTNSFNPVTGVGTGIKNAEFELTPKILRNGTIHTHKMMDLMLRESKDDLVNAVQERLPSIPITLDNVYDNVLQEDFEIVATKLVEQGNQDKLVHEIIPISSRKYGGGVVNDIENDKTFESTNIDFSNKGQQLDASHDVTEHNELAMLTQYLNTVSINYKDPQTLKTLYAAVSKLSVQAVNEWDAIGNVPGATANKIMGLTAESVNKRLGVSYQHRLVNQKNEANPDEVKFSLNDRQIVNTAISQLNSVLEKEGVSVKLFGSQYVLHPQSNLIELVRGDNGNVYLKSEVPSGVKVVETGVDLAWAYPSRNGESLEETDAYADLVDQYNAQLESGANKKQTIEVFQNALDNLLSENGWEAGSAEILLPMSFGKQFFITDKDLNRPIHSYDKAFFKERITTNSKTEFDAAELEVRAEAMVEDFNKMLTMLNVRIPTTAKHSGVVTKVVGFMEESDNSVFVPPMLLFIQGADQDIDKGNIPSYKAVKGTIPTLDDNLEFDDRTKSLLVGNLGNNTYQIALRNKIVEGLISISSNPKNAVENNSAVDALLKNMQSLVTNRKDTYNKDSYSSYLKIRRNNQAGKALVGIFANGQKAYQTLYGYGKLTGDNVGLREEVPGLDRINETFAALINAATDNAKEQILGSLGINEGNANMISFMVMKGMSINQIDTFLQDNAQSFKDIEKSLKYDARAITAKDLPAGDMRNFFKGGKEIGLLGSSILNTDIPNSAFDGFKYQHKLNVFLQDALGRNFSYENFLNSEIYANDSIAALDRAITTGRANFNILKVLNPFATSHPSNTYSRVFKKAVEVQKESIPVITQVNSLMTNYLANFKKGKGVTEDNYNQGFDFIYGLAVHSFLNTESVNSRIGSYDLAKIKDRSEWIQHFNTVVIPKMKDWYASRSNPNAFTEALRPIENKSLHTYQTATNYGVLDMRNLDDAQILTYDVSFNNPQLLDDSDKQMLILYNLITTGGKHGKGSFSQIFRYNEPILKSFNEYLDVFIEDLSTQPMSDLAQVFDKYLKNDIDKGGSLVANAIPYGYSNEIEFKDSHAEQELKLASDVEADNVINGNLTSMAVTEKGLNSSALLKKAVELHKKVNRPRGAVIPNITKVISDGSQGVGMIALEASKEVLDIPTGGKIRKGFKTIGNKSDTSLGPRFGLKDDSSLVEKDNVLDSDVNIIFGDINDTDIGTTLAYANELDKPILIHARTSEQGETHRKITNLLGSSHNANVILFSDAKDLRSKLKAGGYGTLNVVGTKASKLSASQRGIIFDTLLKAFTEDNAINYNSVSGEGGVAITMDENNAATYYPNTGSSIEVSNVYFGDIPSELQQEVEDGAVELTPIRVDEDGVITKIDNVTDVVSALNNNINVVFGVYRNGELDADASNVEVKINPDVDNSSIASYTNGPGQVFIKNVRWVNKGDQDVKSPPVPMSVKGYSSEGDGSIVYHGYLTNSESRDISPDQNKFISKAKFGNSSEKRHTFTILMNQESIVYDRLDVSSPETYTYSRDNNVSIKDEKKIIDYIQSVIVTSDDSDIARRYLESFIVKEGVFYNRVRSILFSHFNDFGDLVNELSDETRAAIDVLVSQQRPIVHTEVKRDTLISILKDAGSTELRPTAILSIQKDINSFSSVNELKVYITAMFNFKSMHSASKNAIFKTYTTKLNKLGGKKSNIATKKKFSSTKNNKRVDTNKSKLSEVKKYDKVGTNFNTFKAKLEFLDGLHGDFKQSFYESLINLSLNMNDIEFKKASKLLTKLGVDAGTSSEILGRDVVLKGTNTINTTNRPSAHIKMKHIPTFVNVMKTVGHTVEATTVSLYDKTKKGVSIIDVMINISNDTNADAYDRKFADKLIGQFDSIANHYNNEEIADITRICTT